MSQNLTGVILVSFEYPPRRLTYLSDKIAKLAKALSENNIKTWVVTFDDWRSDVELLTKKLTIIRIPYPITNNISELSFIMNLKFTYQSAIASIINTEKIQIIHLFEWMCLPPLIPWENKIDARIVYSTTSIQKMRDNAKTPYNAGITKIEQMGFDLADLVMPDTSDLEKKIQEEYQVPLEKIVTQSFKDRKFIEKTLKIYQETLSKEKLVKAK